MALSLPLMFNTMDSVTLFLQAATALSLPLIFNTRDNVALFVQAAMALSDAQMSDIMLLRALYHSKLGALGRERDELIQHMAQNEQGSVHPTEALLRASHSTAELQMNAAEEHQTHYRISLAVYTGVSAWQVVLMQDHKCLHMGEGIAHGVAAAMQTASAEAWKKHC